MAGNSKGKNFPIVRLVKNTGAPGASSPASIQGSHAYNLGFLTSLLKAASPSATTHSHRPFLYFPQLLGFPPQSLTLPA